MNLYATEGVVLRARPVGEADVIVTFYTVDEGKVGASARGARRGRSRLLGATQPFTHSRLMLWRGRSLENLNQVEIIQSFRALREDLPRMAYASYVAELVEALVPEHEPNPQLFGQLLSVLTYLAGSDGAPRALAKAVHVFELRLLSILGYEPQLERCVVCGCELGASSRLSVALGGMLCPLCFERDPQAQVLTMGTLATIRQLMKIPWNRLDILDFGALEEEVGRTLRNLVDSRVEGRLKSLEFVNLIRSE